MARQYAQDHFEEEPDDGRLQSLDDWPFTGDSSGTRMFQGTLTNCNSAVNSGWRV